MTSKMIKKPANISDHFEQLRPAIIRSTGSTPSERYLAKLSDRTFLNLWSYPNPFRAQKLSGNGEGKELCDLLVVCEPHIIVFSEKNITWPNTNLDVAWPRWFRKAVLAAASQLKGAERWIKDFPDRIFLDRECKEKFPLNLPSLEKRRVHRVVVARGAAEACRGYFEGGLGTLIIDPSIKGEDHCRPASQTYSPFTVGDIDPSGDFVHVFDETALDIVMNELDTISDFTEYLDKRSAFIRSGHLGLAHGEEDLLAYYAVRMNENGEHDFTPPNGVIWKDGDILAIGPGHYKSYISSPEYSARAKANENSYAWDRLIETFTNHMLGGTSIVLPGFEYSLTESEIAVRHMALQNRFLRRSHSEAILGALERGRHGDSFFRAMISPEGSPRHETGFFFLTLKYKDWMDETGGYEKYRLMRTHYLKTYAQSFLMKYPRMQRIIGIAMEPPGQGRGASEDIIYGIQSEWTEIDRQNAQRDCEELGIMRNVQEKNHHSAEFPLASPTKTRANQGFYGNRKQRRAQAARERKNR